MTRFEAFVEFREMGSDAVVTHAEDLMRHMHGSSSPWIRVLAIEALSVLEPDRLVKFAPALVQRLSDIDDEVCYHALQVLTQLRPEDLDRHVPAIIHRVSDAALRIQIAALQALDRLGTEALVPHLDAIRGKRSVDEASVRRDVVQMVDKVEREMIRVVVTIRCSTNTEEKSVNVICTSMSGRAFAEVPINQRTTSGDLRVFIANKLEVELERVQLIMEHAALVPHDVDATPLVDVLIKLSVMCAEQASLLDCREEERHTPNVLVHAA
jgi:HEAT repeat protein